MNRVLKLVLLSVFCLFSPIAAQQRSGSFEFSLSPGVLLLDGSFARWLGIMGYPSVSSPSVARMVPSGTARLGYNFSRVWNFSIGTSYARSVYFKGPEIGLPCSCGKGKFELPEMYSKGVKYLTPFAAVTATWNLNARTSPFVTGGTQITLVTSGGYVNHATHPVWGAHAGIGFRHMVNNRLAMRMEGRRAFEHWQYKPGRKTSYNNTMTVGMSWFTAGRHVVKPDTVWVYSAH